MTAPEQVGGYRPDAELFRFDDGMAYANIDDGDGSLPRFVHLTVTNVDREPLPNAVTVALTCAEVAGLGAWLTSYAERATATDPRSSEAATTIHVVVGWDSDSEQSWLNESSPGEFDDTPDQYEADIPAAVWARYDAAHKALNALHQEVVEAAGFDESAGRMAQACAAWQGYETAPRRHFEIVLSESGREDTWPLRPVPLTTRDTEAEAEAYIDALPAEFYVHYGAQPLPLVQRERLSVREAGWGGYVSDCTRCGWDRDEHPEYGQLCSSSAPVGGAS